MAKRVFCTGLTMLGLIALAPIASADVFTYTLDIANSTLTGAGFTAPFGTVTVNLTNSSTAQVTFTTSSNSYLFADGAATAVNANITGTGVTISGGTATNSLAGFTVATPTTVAGSIPLGGLGSFNERAAVNGSCTAGDTACLYLLAAQSISFTLGNTGGTWANAANVLAVNGSGFVAAAHIYACTGGCVSSVQPTVTGGFVGAPVPEPASLLLLGTVLGAIIVLCRKRAFGSVGR